MAAGAQASLNVAQVIIAALNTGFFGVAFWLFVRGSLHSSSEVDRERERADKAEEQRDAALRLTHEQVLPLLTSFNATFSALLPVLQDLVRRQEERVTRRLPRDR